MSKKMKALKRKARDLRKQRDKARQTAMGYASIAVSEGCVFPSDFGRDDVLTWANAKPEGDGAKALFDALDEYRKKNPEEEEDF